MIKEEIKQTENFVVNEITVRLEEIKNTLKDDLNETLILIIALFIDLIVALAIASLSKEKRELFLITLFLGLTKDCVRELKEVEEKQQILFRMNAEVKN